MSSGKARIAVLFDLDGVIVDSREFHMQAWHQWARQHGVQHESDYFHQSFGRRNDAIIGGLLPEISDAEFRRLADAKEQLFRDAARGKISALPGAISLIRTLEEQGVPRAVVTSTPRANLTLILESLRLDHAFGALVAEEDASRGKPDPEGFLVAAQRLDVPAASCIVIEDAPAGLAAAKAAGMQTIGVTTTHPAAALHDADLVVDSLADRRVMVTILGG